jgi:DNA mismatch repair protein MutS2
MAPSTKSGSGTNDVATDPAAASSRMDPKSQALLEFPLIRERLAAYAGFGPSRRLAQALEPSSDAIVVRRGLDQTDEARLFLSERPDAGIGGARDIEPAVGRAARGGRLDVQELLDILATLVAAGRLLDVLRETQHPLLHALGRRIAPLPQLRTRLELSLDPAGDLLDSASPALGGLRRAVRIAYDRLRARLETLVHGSEVGSALQEPIITLRNGRYVVPVRADAKSKVRGIVHDQSGSGQTLFIEPLIAVELGNAWREAQLRVQQEEERILDELSALVATHAAALAETLDALAQFDFWAAKARLAEELSAIRPEEAERQEVVLVAARHPGLTGRVVPTTIRIGGEYTAVVITGPNTGGKTVALRTIGLLSLMHQAGLHVPALPGTRLPVFQNVFADIGDEQSVAQSLSTFSGHLRSIVRIVELAGPGTLVLLDELGAGTDPTEGSALAQALLDYFIRAGALILATTHYAELKTYAHNTPQARNAAVEFNLETLSPTYHLTIGLPGTSQAFAIAERLGLANELVQDARSRLSRAQLEFEQTLASIKAGQAAVSEAETRAGHAEAEARVARIEAEEERRRARREREEAVAMARREAESALAAVHAEIEGTRRMLERETLTEARLDEAMSALERRLAALPLPGEAPPESADLEPVEWRSGMAAATRTGFEGTLVSVDIDRGRGTLQMGGLRAEVDLADLVRPGGAAWQEQGERSAKGGARAGRRSLPADRPGSGRRGEFGDEATSVRPRREATGSGSGANVAGNRPDARRAAIPSSLDLRGARVEEATDALERYIDQAATAEAGRVTIIHGHGSGALRDAVREFLTSHPLVREWRPGERGEGGDGATIVSL